jgi:uncharacterized protein
MKHVFATLLALTCLSTLASAKVGDLLKDDGQTNPEEQTLDYFANKYDYGNGKSTACVYGYWATKAGNHVDAKKIFDKCLAAGVDAVYPWEAYMSQNGYGTRQSPEDAAAWDKKSADRGYKVGQFNHGLNLLRGFGVKRDIAAGKAMINRSAAQGFAAAQDLAKAGYDPEVSIPDADEQGVY